MADKEWCENSGTAKYETRRTAYGDGYGTQALAKCQSCGRVLKPTPARKLLRKHQVRGATTASMDKTMDTLWQYAEEPRRVRRVR